MKYKDIISGEDGHGRVCWHSQDALEGEKYPRPDRQYNIHIVDNKTGIVYSGLSSEGTGDLQSEVEDYLGIKP